MLVDDHPVVLEGLAELLAEVEGIEVVARASTLLAAEHHLNCDGPDAVLLDIRIGGEESFGFARTVKERRADAVKVVLFSSYDDLAYVEKAMAIPVDGYLCKDASPDSLIDALFSVAGGERVLSPKISARYFEHGIREGRRHSCSLAREDLELLRLIAQGLSNGRIACALNMSERTVKRRVSAINAALGVVNRAQAVARAYELGML